MRIRIVLPALVLSLGLAACVAAPPPAPTGIPSLTPAPAATLAPDGVTPPAAPTVISVPAANGSPVSPLCAEQLTPADGAQLGASGAVTFSWQPVSGATLYRVYILFPTKVDLTFDVEETSLTRYLEAFSMHPAYQQGGEHRWKVIAINAAGEEICSSAFFVFTKPDS